LIKWLLLLVVGAVFYSWLKRQKQAAFDLKNTPKIKIPPVKPMVQCEYCNVYLAQSDAIGREGRYYCSNEHLFGVDDRGWIGAASWRLSPNQNERPEGVYPDLVVIHHISLPPGAFVERTCTPYIIDFFQNKLDPSLHPYFAEIVEQKVSSHFLISRKGELIQFVSTHQRAWHAGRSSFLGREQCNDFSIGIELEGDGDTHFEELQYDALTGLVRELGKKYPALEFAGHSDIAPNRKTDPGIQFDWKKFQKKTDISVNKFPFGLAKR
jgi:N-acetyl-anhydromuramoyl-L-alanine amidase